MSRYVDAEELFLDFQTDPEMRLGENLEYVRKTINKQATADVRENVHGEWELMESYWDDNTWRCSVCGEPFVLIEGEPYQNGYYFCPNCGADMRKEVEE